MDVILQDFGDSRLAFRPLPWDAKAFSRNCYELDLSLGKIWPDPTAVRDLMRQNAMQAVTCRCRSGNVDTSRFLLALGFFHAELQLEYLLPLAGRTPPGNAQGVLRLARVEDDEQILDIAATSYPGGRFLFFRDVTMEMVGTRFRNWTAQILARHRDLALVLDLAGEVVGYFASEPTSGPKRVNLTLAASKRGCGRLVGHELFTSALAWYAKAGFHMAGASLSANNLAVLNLYASLGAAFVKAVDFFQWDALAAHNR